MLERAGGLPCDPDFARTFRPKLRDGVRIDHLAEIARRNTDAGGRGTLRPGRMPQQVAVILGMDAAAARGADDRLAAALEQPQARLDVVARLRQRRIRAAEVVIHRAAAADLARGDQGNAESVEHARGGGVDLRRETRLHAAFEHRHATRVPW